MEAEKKELKEEHPVKRKSFTYLGILIVLSFLSIRISGYNVSSSDSLFFLVAQMVKNSIVNKEFFLIEIALLILFEMLVFVLLIIKKKSGFALLTILLLWAYIYIHFNWVFDNQLFLISSLPFLLFSLAFLVLVLHTIWRQSR
ncbi:hypothetical protein [Fluviicola sp.]|uniref:hypothetical protein n=1 Tax=Fluviicola sp. TaxID=1917219 RepID=UPI003D2A0C68